MLLGEAEAKSCRACHMRGARGSCGLRHLGCCPCAARTRYSVGADCGGSEPFSAGAVQTAAGSGVYRDGVPAAPVVVSFGSNSTSGY